MPESLSASKTSESKVSGDWSQNLCPSSKYNIKAPHSMEPIGICMHNTANSAPASNEISYMNSNNNQVSFHLCVDEKEAIQGLPFNRNGWHAGDGNGQGNRKHIGIEIARSTSSDANQFAMAEKRAAAVVAKLLQQYGWGISNVKAHRDFASKNCPHRTDMAAFKKMVEQALEGKLTTTSTTGAATTATVNESAASGTAKVTCDVLNVRQGPGTNYSILGTLSNGKTATIQAQSGNWYKISYGGGSGWISKDYVTVSSASSTSTSKPATSGSSGTSSSGGSITAGSKVKITGSNYATGQSIPGWVKSNTYTVKQISGNRALISEIVSWVYLSDLQLVGGNTSSGTTSKPASSGTSGSASSGGTKLDQLLASNPGVKTNQDLINLFYKIGGNNFNGAAAKAREYGVDINALIANRNGKVSASGGSASGGSSSGGSTTTSTSTAYVTCDVLNVRSGAGTGNSKIGQVTYGTKLTVQGESNGWYKIQYGSGSGWVCASYTSKNNPSSGGGGATTSVNGIRSDKGFADASYNVAMSMGGYKSQGLCATGVSRAIKNYYGYTVWGNGNQIDDNLPKDKFQQINVSLADALKVPGLILTWEATATKLGAIYGHTAITQGNGSSSSCDFYEYNTLGCSGRTGYKCFVHK